MWHVDTSLKAAENGHLGVVKYLHENDCYWDDRVCSLVAEKGDLPLLKYLHENGCHWNENTCSKAYMNGHFKVLRYLHENGCLWNTGETPVNPTGSTPICVLNH